MISNKLKIPIASMLVLSMFYSFGCILNPKEDPEPPPPPKPWPKATTEIIVIDNLLRSYADKNYVEYGKLLHEQYEWHMQEDPETHEIEIWDRTMDVGAVTNMFNAAKGRPPEGKPAIERISLDIYGGQWEGVDSVAGEYWPGSWSYDAQYSIEVVIGETTYLGNDKVLFLIVPVVTGSDTLFQIRMTYDYEQQH